MGDKGGDEFIIALERDAGRSLAGEGRGELGRRRPPCTPTVSGALVYAISPHGDLVCVEAAGGKERWRKSFKDDFGGR